jgi:3-hydroxyacyl-CoA dehydrogenase/enoyl-CoA hydratase/3-hydroxybutyryl-CoA epimerase
MSFENLQHWHVQMVGENTKLVLDKANSSVNVLDREVMGEFEQIVEHFEQEPPKALMITSAKKAGFLAGADISEFQDLDTHEQVISMLQRGQNLFLRVERLKCPTVALIHGHCMGGGMELALACDYRVVEASRDCKLGLPEVKLGIHPGYGGAIRLPRLIDPGQALQLMLAGRILDGRAAKRAGIADIAVHSRYFEEAGAALLKKGKRKPKRDFKQNVYALPPVRTLVGAMAAKQVAKKASKEHYPAPYRIIDFWKENPGGQESAYRAEAESVAKLFADANSVRAIENLVRIFLLDKELKSEGKKTKFEGAHVHVVGAGVMGGDIAAWCALSGLRVTLQDAKPEFIAPAIKRAHKLFKRKLKATHLVNAAMDRLIPDPQALGVPQADLIIEAITERLDAKKGLYAALEPLMKPDAILATNTSSLPLEQLCEGLARPERLVGIHFFNPVALMQLVEVVRGENTSDEVVSLALGVVTRISKLPLEVKSSPGFLVNRVLMAYLGEAMKLYQEGVQPELIDELAVELGMPMGPIELSDTVGLDICQAVAEEMISAFGGGSSDVLTKHIEKGNLGRKSGQGFYTWKKGKAVKQKASRGSNDIKEISDRMLYMMLNESVQCLAENVVRNPDSLDMGMIFGTGFPPFLGGPMQYMRSQGKEFCATRLSELESSLGERFTAKPGWANLQL